MNLSATLQEALAKSGFVSPTPIQAQAIPVAIEGRDVIGIAQTGTGKTLAFGLPILERILHHGGVALVLAPTRELAEQIDVSLNNVGAHLGLRTAILIGGASMRPQMDQLRRRPNVIVATPGRLMDFMRQGIVRLDRIEAVVLDEADRMLDMGFLPDIRQILQATLAERQTMLFSATMPDEIAELTNQFLKSPERIEISRAGQTAELVNQELYFTKFENKPDVLEALLSDTDGTVLIFTRTRHGARKLAQRLRHSGHRAAEIHADRTQLQRRQAMEGFRRGHYRILVATDIAARGIDVKDIALVVNFDLPDNIDDYVHRIGRTGRAGSAGRAATLALPGQRRHVRSIEKLTGQPIVEMPLPDWANLPERDTTPFLDDQPIHLPKPQRFDRDPGERGAKRSRRPERGPRPPFERLARPSYDRNAEAPVAAVSEAGSDTAEAHRPRFDRSAADRPVGDRPTFDRPRFDRPRDERPQFDRPRGDRPPFNRAQGDRPYDRPPFDRSQSDRPQLDRSRGDRPPFDRGQGDRPRFDRNAPREGGYRRDDRPNRDFNGGRGRSEGREGGYNRDSRPAQGGYQQGGYQREGRPAPRFNDNRGGGYNREGSGREGFRRDQRDDRSHPGNNPREGGYQRDRGPKEGGFNRGPAPREGFRRDARPDREGGFNRDERKPRTEGGFERPTRRPMSDRTGSERPTNRQGAGDERFDRNALNRSQENLAPQVGGKKAHRGQSGAGAPAKKSAAKSVPPQFEKFAKKKPKAKASAPKGRKR